MSNDQQLVPLFVPPLAAVLGHAEHQKGSPLTAPEVEAIRDKSACIMLTVEDAAKMAASRGYVDVNPDNCWSDWHRLRPQMVGGYLPRIILCIPGQKHFRDACELILKAEQIKHEFRPADRNLAAAFRAASQTWPTFTPADHESISAHSSVLYVLSENFVSAEAPSIASQFLRLGQRLLDAGGIAIKCESSGIAHSVARWSQFDSVARRSDADRWSALFYAYTVFPIGSETDLYTCGMHLLGAPDLIISQSAAEAAAATGESAPSAAAKLFTVFAIYLLSECPTGKFGSGHTFSTAAGAPRYRVLWEACNDFAQDSYFFNPYGRWRFVPFG